MFESESEDPQVHVVNLKQQISDLRSHIERDIRRIHDPQARALFEMTREVLTGLLRAFAQFESQAQATWQPAGEVR